MNDILKPLDIPVPPNLELAFGYQNPTPERYVAFYWEPCGDEFMFYDGFVRSTNGNWHSFRVFSHHPLNLEALALYDFGSSDNDARHYLILDTQERKLYVADAKDAEKLFHQLAREKEDHPVLSLSEEAQKNYADMVIEAFLNAPPPSAEDVANAMNEEHKQYTQLVGWLNEEMARRGVTGREIIDRLVQKLSGEKPKNYWISWQHDRSYSAYELHHPWWVSGSGAGYTCVCAAVRAGSEEAAKQIVAAAYDLPLNPDHIEWRFCEERPADWSPFSDRFPRANWMKWE